MAVTRISDWGLEDRLHAGGAPLVVLFADLSDVQVRRERRAFQRLSADYGDAAFCELDVLENPEVVSRYRLSGTPLTLIFVRGAERGRARGAALELCLADVLGPGA